MPARPLLSSDRVRAYLTLVPYLLERGQVSLEEAAAEFDTSVEEMRRLVEKLTVIGLPGDNGYWQQPHEMFDIDWDLLDEHGIIEITNEVGLRQVPRFSAREASALLAGLQVVATVPAIAESGVVAGLISKLSRAAATAPAEVVIVPTAVDEVRRVVAEALRTRVAVAFRYRAPDSPETIRTVDPVQVLITDGQWYLQGWCHLREAMRTFHLDRVSDPVLTTIPSTHADEHAPVTFGSDPTADGAVLVRLPASLAPLLGDYLRPDEVEEETDGCIRARLHLSDPRGIKRLAARLGGALEVLDPPVAREAAREWAEAGLALYPPTGS